MRLLCPSLLALTQLYPMSWVDATGCVCITEWPLGWAMPGRAVTRGRAIGNKRIHFFLCRCWCVSISDLVRLEWVGGTAFSGAACNIVTDVSVIPHCELIVQTTHYGMLASEACKGWKVLDQTRRCTVWTRKVSYILDVTKTGLLVSFKKKNSGHLYQQLIWY